MSTSGSRPENFKGERIEYLMSQGWSVLYVVVPAGVRPSDTAEMKQRRRQDRRFSEWLPSQIVQLHGHVSGADAPRYISCDSLGEVKSEGVLDAEGHLVVIQRQKYQPIDAVQTVADADG